MLLPLFPPARSPRRLGQLCAWLLLFAGASGRLAAAFHSGRSFIPANPVVGSVAVVGPQWHNSEACSVRQVGRSGSMCTSAANGSDSNNKLSKSKSKRSAVAPAVAGLLSFASITANAYAYVSVGGSIIFKGTATAAAATAAAREAVRSPLVLPPVRMLALACILPALMGYYKSEYGVSYGYGTAVAASSYLVLSSIAAAAGLPLFPALLPALKESVSVSLARPISLKSVCFQTAGVQTSLRATLQSLKALLPASLPAFHASSLLFYGARLDLFLLYRELFLARFRAMRERIEQRAKKQGGRWSRTPFLISCAFLYFCLTCPLLITSQLCEGLGMACGPLGELRSSSGLVSILEQSLRLSMAMALSGFLLGALGDLNKTIGKALRGEDALVTWGVFRFFRHPNYTGETIGWACSCLAGFLAVAWKAAKVGAGSLDLWKEMAPYLLMSIMGATGISFVLATATTGLEYRQKEKYGDTEKYEEWIKRSWVGFKMHPAPKDSSITVNVGGSDK